MKSRAGAKVCCPIPVPPASTAAPIATGWSLRRGGWRARRSDPQPETGGRQGRGKDARWKSPKADFPTALGNPAKCAGFPLSHRLGGCGRLTKTGHFTCYEKRTFYLANNIVGCRQRASRVEIVIGEIIETKVPRAPARAGEIGASSKQQCQSAHADPTEFQAAEMPKYGEVQHANHDRVRRQPDQNPAQPRKVERRSEEHT